MKINKISFKLSAETFGPDTEPTDVAGIYIDGENLCDIISCGLPLWPSELYMSLMRSCFLKDESVNIFVCGCGCVGCGDTEVHIDETEHFVIWYDFIKDLKHIEPDTIFVFEREQYYTEVDKILKWIEKQRLAHYIGNVFTIWSDEFRLKLLAENLSDTCILKCDFNSSKYMGKKNVLEALRNNLIIGDYERKEAENYLYRLHGYDSDMENRGYYKWYMELSYHERPHDIAMFVVFKKDIEGKIDEILLSRSTEWFKPVRWSSRYPLMF